MGSMMRNSNLNKKNSNLFEECPELNARFQSLPGINSKMSIQDGQWKFKFNSSSGNNFHTMNFNIFDNINAFKKVKIVISKKSYSVTTKDFFKVLALELFEAKQSSKAFKDIFNFLVKLNFYLDLNSANYVEKEQFELLFAYVMKTEVVNGSVRERHSLLAFSSWYRNINFEEIALALKHLKLKKTLLEPTTIRTRKKALSSALLSLGDDISLQDYIDGKSFNFLTLDYGRHYVEHMSDFFEDCYLIALACKKTISESDRILTLSGKQTSRQTQKGLIRQVLSGTPLATLKENNRRFAVNLPAVEKIYFETKSTFCRHYQKELTTFGLFKSDTIDALLKILLLENNEHNQSLLTSMLIANINKKDTMLDKIIEASELSSRQSVNSFKKICEEYMAKEIFEAAIPILSEDFYERIDLSSKTDLSSVIYLIDYMECAGATQFVALTGWRESEFGFGLSNVNTSMNNEPLDNNGTPLRYIIDWVVPKTHGEIKLNREIVQPAYLLLLKMNKLVTDNERMPCLYPISNNKVNPFSSANHIKKAASRIWPHFVKNYQCFKDIKRLTSYKNIQKVLTPYEAKDFTTLEEKYKNVSNLKHLTHIMNRLESELPRLTISSKSSVFAGLEKHDVFDYVQGLLPESKKVIWEKHLPDDLKLILHTKINSKEDISAELTTLISNALKENCIYPSPHAFRHMWAEAVFRRFSGDIGWFIRSNFKHTSQYMFQKYLLNKENKSVIENSKRKVMSSLLKKHILSMDDEGNAYAGKTDIYLKRVFKNTKVVNIDELDSLLESYVALEIEDIKSNSWGYCLLRKRGKHLARCAEEGVPNRHLASIDFCIGCTNNLIEQEQIPGIMFLIENDLNVLKQSNIPNAFTRKSTKVAKDVLRELKKLDQGQNSQKIYPYIKHIEEALREAA